MGVMDSEEQAYDDVGSHDDAANPSDAGIRGTGSGVVATWRYTVASLIFIAVVLYSMVFLFVVESAEPLSVRNVAVLVLAVISLAGSIRYFWFFRSGLGSGLPPLRYNILLLAPSLAILLIGTLAPTAIVFSILPFWLAVNCLAILVKRPLRWKVLVAGAVVVGLQQVAVVFLAFPNESFLASDYLLPYLTMAFYAALLPLAFIGGIWWWEIVLQLDHSRKTAAQLAVTRERLRFASDLHDIQGHHLQVIALKTELAERLMDADPAAAKIQIHEAQELARTALVDTRALVRGYRRTDLATEAANAADVLQAAGINCSVDLDHQVPDAASQQLFGTVIRESTTNILRHSDATNVSMRLHPVDGRTRLSIRNDGVEPVRSSPGDADANLDDGGSDDGTGITSLRERFRASGGSVAGKLDGTSFELVTELPGGTP